MITTAGARWIRRYMAQQVETMGESVAFGIGDTTPSVDDLDLEYEVMRASIGFRSYDPDTGEIVFRVSVPNDMPATITEVALWANASDNDGTAQSQQLVDFDPNLEPWVEDGTFVANSRIGDSALQLTGDGTSTLTTEGLSLEAYGGNDQFALAIGPVLTGSATLTIRMRTDDLNYFQYVATVDTGGEIIKFNKSTATITGNPSWDAINDIQFIISDADNLSVRLEGVRVLNSENSLADYVLIARQVIAPFQTDPTKTNEIELRIGTTIT